FDDISEKIEHLGFGVQSEKLEFDVLGMTCAACSNRVEKVLNKQDGITNASVNLPNETATIEYNPGLTKEDKILDAIQSIGYDAKAKSDQMKKDTQKEKQMKRMQIKLIVSVILSIPLLLTMLDHLLGISVPNLLMNPWFQFALATPVQFVIGWQFY